MKAINQFASVLVLAGGAFLVGCNERPVIASPSCADIEKITDPAKKSELLKRCPRSGPAFKPSEEKNW